jgi:hypothetical protein
VYFEPKSQIQKIKFLFQGSKESKELFFYFEHLNLAVLCLSGETFQLREKKFSLQASFREFSGNSFSGSGRFEEKDCGKIYLFIFKGKTGNNKELRKDA